MLSAGELAAMTRLTPEHIAQFDKLGIYKGLHRRGRYLPLALAVTDVMVEIGYLVDTGAITEAQGRSLAVLKTLRKDIEKAFAMRLVGLKSHLTVRWGKTAVNLFGHGDAARSFEQLCFLDKWAKT
jgi:hypothetical protein